MRHLLLLAALFAFPASAFTQTKFAYKFGKDTKVIYEMVSNVKQEMTVMDQNITVTVNSGEVAEWTLKEKNKEGNLVLQKESKRLTMDMSMGLPFGGNQKYKFDSRDPEDKRDNSSAIGRGATPALEKLAGSIITVTITPQGKPKAVKGYAELLKDVAKGGPFGQMFAGGDKKALAELSEYFIAFPNKALKVGDTWEIPFEQKLQQLGTVKGKRTYKYEGDEKGLAKFSVLHDMKFNLKLKQDGADITGTVEATDSKGVVLFNPKTGRMESMKVEYKAVTDATVEAGENEFELKQTMSVKTVIKALDKLPK